MEVGVITEFSGELPCISVWDLSTSIRLKTYKNCYCTRNGLAFVTNNYLISAQHDTQMLHIYDTQNERLVKRIVCPGKISSLAISPDSNYCIVGLQEKIYIWQLSSGNLMNILSKHYQNITCIKFTDDGSFFITCGEDNLIIIWNFVNALQPRDPCSDIDICDQPLHTITSHSMAIQDIHVGVNGMRSTIATCSLDQTCKLFDICTGKMICTFVFDVGCTSVAMDVIEKNLFVGTLDGSIFFINCHSKKTDIEMYVGSQKENILKAHKKCINSLCVTMDGTKLISGSLDCIVKLWHINNRQCLKSFSFNGEISNVCIKLFARTFERKEEKVKHSIGNFKRAVFVPGNFAQILNSDSVDEETLFPVVLEDVNEYSVRSCVLPENASFTNDFSLVDKIMLEYVSQKTQSNNLQLQSATRAELVEKVKGMENMTKEIYSYTTDYLLKDLNGKCEDTEMKTDSSY